MTNICHIEISTMLKPSVKYKVVTSNIECQNPVTTVLQPYKDAVVYLHQGLPGPRSNPGQFDLCSGKFMIGCRPT